MTKLPVRSVLLFLSAQTLGRRVVDSLSIPVYYDSTNHLHRDLSYHAEQPLRIQACVEALTKYSAAAAVFGSSVDLIDIAESSPHAFSQEELDHARYCLVQAHSESLVAGLETRCRNSKQARIDEGKPPLGFIGYLDEGDTYVTTETYDVCLRATAAWIRAVDKAMKLFTTSLAMTRPPGHHATATRQNGFCLFNFAAAAALHVLQAYPEARISILDWDVHYGQGVADIVQHQPRARYVSIHQTPAFPYEGESKQVRGENNNIYTIPIRAETSWTCGYEQAMKDEALPFVYTAGEWEPDLVLVCSGYDALDSDMLASVSLQASDYGRMTRALREHIGPSVKLALGLEGGYQLSPQAGGGNLQDAVIETIKALAD